MFVVILAVSVVGAFVGGVLFGRRNTKKVELAVSQVEKILPK